MTNAAQEFDLAMFEIYRRALDECNYQATYFLQMLQKEGGMATALRLIRAPNPSEGFTALWEKNRLDLSVEALVQQKPWRSLFSESDIRAAAKRLRSYGFVVPDC